MRKKIILIEDNPADAELVKIAVEDLQLITEVVHLVNHESIFDYLRNSKQDIHLILLDLNMPRVGGLEILEQLKAHEIWKMIPVVVFSTSSNKNDVLAAYNLGANAYICKPMDFSVFNDTIQSTVDFWLDANMMPRLF
jgi:CheY-like chemotaxis protein